MLDRHANMFTIYVLHKILKIVNESRILAGINIRMINGYSVNKTDEMDVILLGQIRKLLQKLRENSNSKEYFHRVCEFLRIF